MKTSEEIIKRNGLYLMPNGKTEIIRRCMEEYAEEKIALNKPPSKIEIEEKINDIVNNYNTWIPVDCAIRDGINWIISKMNNV
jgi:hypothetical protein